MTRDEAKKFLTNLSWSVGTTAMEYWGDETGRKIREAVKAFEPEPKPCRAIHERKEGFWDAYTDCEGKRTYYTCPFCKNKTNHFMYEPKYCDKCGARLKIEGSDSDAVD